MTSFRKDKLFIRSCELDDCRELKIFQSEIGDVGCVVWDAAIVLAKFYEHVISTKISDYSVNSQSPSSSTTTNDDVNTNVYPCAESNHHTYCNQESNSIQKESLIYDQNDIQHLLEKLATIHHNRGLIYELGAGTGYVGIVAASLGGTVVLTDLPEFVDLMQYNIDENQNVIHEANGSAQAETLIWGTSTATQKADIILIADCIYYDQSVKPLIKTLTDLSSDDTIIVCCHEERTTGNKPQLQHDFFTEIKKQFHVTTVPASIQHPQYSSSDILLHMFVKKQPVTCH